MGPALADGCKTLLWYFVGAGTVDKYTLSRSATELHEYVNRIGKMIKYTFEYDDIINFYSIVEEFLGTVVLEYYRLNVRKFD